VSLVVHEFAILKDHAVAAHQSSFLYFGGEVLVKGCKGLGMELRTKEEAECEEKEGDFFHVGWWFNP
jgi:hypothetical protein